MTRRPLVLALFALVAFALCAPMLRFPSRWADPYDWRYFQAMEEAFRHTVLAYRQVPLWNPYACGGEVGLANPQSTVAAPTFLLTLAFGTPLGLRLAVLVYLFCALDGTFRLARDLGMSTAGALVAGLAFGGCGWFAMHLSSGHVNFAGAALYPYLLLCFRRAALPRTEPSSTAWRWTLPAGALLAWMAGLGGTYTVPMGVVLLAAYGAGEALAHRSPRPLLVGVAVGLVALAIGAARLLPLLEFALDHPRHVAEHDGNGALDVLRMFFSWRHTLAPVDGHVYWWHEYGCHLPYLALALAPLGLLAGDGGERRLRPIDFAPALVFAVWTAFAIALPGWDRYFGARLIPYRDAYHLLGATALLVPVLRRNKRPRDAGLLAVVLLGLGIVVGTAWPHGPWGLVRRLPLYRDLRVPSRYLVLVALVLALWAGRGLDVARAWLATHRVRTRPLAATAVALVLVEVLAYGLPTYDDARFLTMRAAPVDEPAFYQEPGDWTAMLDGVIARRGTLKCDEEAPLQRGELDPGPGEQVRLLDPSAGSAELVAWSPNRLAIAADLARPTEVLVNENWNEHWRARGGRAVSVAGRLAIAAPAGRATLVLRYRPRSFVVGALVSALALPLALAGFVLASFRRRRRRAASGRPPVRHW